MISHDHKVIFVHIPKTGGQSVEQMFLDDLGLSWDTRAELTLRRNDDPAKGPYRLAHLYADEYVSKGHVTQDQWESYLKFAVVRNPYDRLVSEYLYRDQIYRNRKWLFWRRPGPKRFITRTFADDFSDEARHLVPQLRYVADKTGQIIVDHIIRFETMGTDIEALLADVMKTPRSLPYRNKTKSGNPAHKQRVRDILTPLIAQKHKQDFDVFGYQI